MRLICWLVLSVGLSWWAASRAGEIASAEAQGADMPPRIEIATPKIEDVVRQSSSLLLLRLTVASVHEAGFFYTAVRLSNDFVNPHDASDSEVAFKSEIVFRPGDTLLVFDKGSLRACGLLAPLQNLMVEECTGQDLRRGEYVVVHEMAGNGYVFVPAARYSTALPVLLKQHLEFSGDVHHLRYAVNEYTADGVYIELSSLLDVARDD